MIKQLVVAMSLLGFVSCPVFAATTETNSSTTHHKRHNHHKVKYHEVKEVKADEQDQPPYAEMGPGPVTPPPAVCMSSQNSMIIGRMTQSLPDVTSQGLGLGRSMPSGCNSPGWFNRIQISGGINVDMGKFGNRNQAFMGENYQRVSLNDAYINLAAVITDWAKAFASISYNTATINEGITSFDPFSPLAPLTVFGFGPFPSSVAAEYSSAYSNNVKGNGNNALQLEQAYITFSNFEMSPVFVQVGKQFQDFSRYEIHPIERSMTQVMSEILATSAKIGFIADGFNGSVYAFDDPLPKVFHGSTTTNYGGALGYEYPSDQLGFDVGAAYLYNLVGVNDVAYIVNQYTLGTGYHNQVSATALYADVNVGPFVLGARYTTALKRFKLLDLPKNGLVIGTSGAKPWAAGASAGYGFNCWGKNQNVYLGYQESGESGGLNLPKYRWLIGYGVELLGKNTNVGIEWDHDKDYSKGNGGSGNSSNLLTLRTAVKFG